MVAARLPSARGVVATLFAVTLAATAVTAGGAVISDPDVVDEAVDRAHADVTVTDTAPNGTNATVMVAPRGTGDRLTTVEAIERARENGRLTRSSIVAMGDTVVFRLTLPGVAGSVANASGDADDSRFRSFLGRENVSLRLVQQNVSPMRPRHYFYLNGSAGQTVVADSANDTYYVAADLTDVPSAGRESGIDSHLPPADFVPRLVVDGEHRLNPGDLDGENQTGEFELLSRDAMPVAVESDARLDPGFAAAPNQTITGYTTLAPGSTVTVRVTDAAGIETPQTATARVTRKTVEPDEYDPPKFVFQTALNLSGVEPGTDIGLRLASNGTTFDVYEHDRYRAPVVSADAEVELPTTSPIRNDAVRVERAVLPDGGFVTVEQVTDGTVVGSSDYLDPGTHKELRVSVSGHVTDNSTLRVSLAHDSDGDESYFVGTDRSYADSMRPVGVTVSWNATAAAIDDRTTTPNATVMVAPDGKREALSSRAAIRRAQREGWLTRSDQLAVGDTFVLRLTAPGIAGAVADQTGSTDEARFESLLARSNTSLLVSEKYPTPHRPREHLYLDATNATTVVAEPDNDTYYVAADLTALPQSFGDDERSSSEPHLVDGDEYVPRFVVDGDHRLNPGDIGEPNQTAQFAVYDPDAAVVVSNETTDTVRVGPAPNQTITGLANVAPGTAVTVRLFNGSGEPFPVTETVRAKRMSEDFGGSQFNATYDLSSADPGTEFDIEIRANGMRVDDIDSGYVDPELVPTATPTPTPTQTPAPTPTATETPTETPHRDPGITPTETQTPTATTETTAGDGPGFGVLPALAGLALAGLGTGARRRRDD
ncbi:BGTF surface domain-containing protein [Halosimplex sp. TS25]|uniref:BGTF surface domain-containing protein n=1 Tax=Halosimplex rarum TaxID=3396619 RepID=UPI0039E954CD